MVERERLCTAEDLEALSGDGQRYALVRGKLIAMPPTGDLYGEIVMALSLLIGNFVRAHSLGRLYAAETGFKLTSDPDTVLAPDFAFISQARVVPREGGFLLRSIWLLRSPRQATRALSCKRRSRSTSGQGGARSGLSILAGGLCTPTQLRIRSLFIPIRASLTAATYCRTSSCLSHRFWLC